MSIRKSSIIFVLSVVTLLLLTVPSSHAQPDLFSERIIISGGQDRVQSVFSCDLNGDQLNDILSISYEDHKLCWYENLPEGFGPQNLIADTIFTDIREGTVVGEDIDGDGDKDIVVTSTNIIWYENLDGLGQFGAPALVCDTITRADKILCFDMDGDNDLDVVASDRLSNIAIWVENMDGSGTFGTVHVITNEMNRPLSFSCSDLDGDSDLDVILVSGASDSVVWFENLEGVGQFGSPILISEDCIVPAAVVCGDIDGDGDSDCIVGSSNDERISLFRNTDGLGTFGTRVILTQDADDPVDLFLADVDGDDDSDILLASEYDSRIAWLQNEDGEGNFGTLTDITRQVDSPVTVFAADLDGDEDLDVLTGSSYDRTSTLVWIENTNGTGEFDAEHYVTPRIYAPVCLCADDPDGDGDNDLLVSANGGDNITCFTNSDGNGLLYPQQILIDNIDSPGMVVAADINGDQIKDVITGSKLDDWIAWYPGTGTIEALNDQHLINQNIPFVISLHCADLDGDSDIDVLAYSWDDRVFFWHENTSGVGDFGPQQNLAAMNSAVVWISSADLDSDGDVDVLGCCNANVGAFWIENTDGNGSFSEFQRIDESLSSSYTILPADIDGDGDTDLVTLNGSFPRITWYENTDGLAHFERNTVPQPPGTPASCTISDYDCDGDLDLVVHMSSAIYWIENSDGAGTFTDNHLVDEVEGEFHFMLSADLDTDGDEDLLRSSGNEQVDWYRNLSEGSPIQPFNLLYPEDGAVVSGDTLLLDWEDAPDLDSNVQLYAVYISDNENTLFESEYDSTSLSELHISGEPDNTYYWSVIGRDGHGYEAEANQVFTFTITTTGLSDKSSLIPEKFEIRNIYPNPFNPETVVSLAIPETGKTTLSVYNILGQRVAMLQDEVLQAGYHPFTFSGQGLAGGCYFVEAKTTGQQRIVRKIVLLK